MNYTSNDFRRGSIVEIVESNFWEGEKAVVQEVDDDEEELLITLQRWGAGRSWAGKWIDIFSVNLLEY